MIGKEELLNNKDFYKSFKNDFIFQSDAQFWMTVLTDLKARGIEDILITATDNLDGFTRLYALYFHKHKFV